MIDDNKTRTELLNELATLRQQAEQKLSDSEAMFRTIFEDAPLGITVINQNYRFIQVNRRMCNIIGYTEQELLQHAFVDITHPDDVSEWMLIAQQMFEGWRPYHRLETRCVTKNRRTIWVNWTFAIIPGQSSQSSCLMGMIEDITERKQTEDKLYYQVNLLKDVSDAIISTDKQFNIRSWNLVAEQMYGYDASETIGKPTGKILNIEHTQYSSWEQVLAQINRCGVWRGEVIIRHKDNTPINVSVAISTIRNRAGIPHGYVAIHSDITKRKQAEHALQESENKFRTLTETMAAGVFIYQNTKLLYINPKMAHILGYSYKDLQQENGLEKIQVNFRKLLSAGKVSRLSNQQKQVPRYEIKTTTEQGEERWFDWIAGIIEYRGKPAVLGTVFDITAHKLAEIQLRQSEENLRQVVESMPVS